MERTMSHFCGNKSLPRPPGDALLGHSFPPPVEAAMNARFVVTVCVLAVVAFGAAGLALYLGKKGPDPLPPREDPGQGRRDVIAAFEKPPAEPPAKDFERFFEDFGQCLRAGGAGGERFWDIPRYAREVDRDGALARAGVRPDKRSRNWTSWSEPDRRPRPLSTPIRTSGASSRQTRSSDCWRNTRHRRSRGRG